MILQRTATAIRARDWVAVAIEFAIVVLGIFVALQAQNWNQARQDRQLEQVYLARMAEETRALRALATFGAFQEVSPGVFANNAVSELYRDRPGVLVELPAVLPDAERLLKERGMRERCTLLGTSFFEPIEAKGEVWTLSQVLHDWPDKECRAILDWMMLLYFGEARQRTVEEYEELFNAAGLELTRVLDTPTAFSIVEARPV